MQKNAKNVKLCTQMQNAENACECVREKMIRIPGKNDTGTGVRRGGGSGLFPEGGQISREISGIVFCSEGSYFQRNF